MGSLAQKTCVPCEKGTQALSGGDLAPYLQELDSAWEVVDDHHLHREFEFEDFASALAFVNKVGELAEQENHHPTLTFTYGKATVELFTHNVGGLSENDFVLAAKIDQLGPGG